ncbi:uncharacterized protein EDB91DRAFT_1122461 [Suillus paluster]|uniref:uncharacterized protein n=1 Tax=Suillus paluster TaxID=48578 RepID=UPI001B85CC06|nr:uncharacterized protein EDB91DRAFT_1122461 [Suillus paluster]KAG1745098.1 hypothetical protein EDB91DRAFT_1122461 [Suillus paluster]
MNKDACHWAGTLIILGTVDAAQRTRQSRPQGSGYKKHTSERLWRSPKIVRCALRVLSLTLVILHIIMEDMSITTVTTRSGSVTSMSITNALSLSTTDRLTPAERKAFGKSDYKAGKVLGVTLTRNHVEQANQDRRLASVPCPDQQDTQGGNTLGEMMALIGAKRSRNRSTSAVTIIRPLKNLGRGLASGVGMDLVEKRNKKRRVAGEYTQRVVFGPLYSNESRDQEDKEELSTAVRDDSACSFLRLDESEDTNTPLAGKFLVGDDEEGEDDLFGNFPRGFVWDVENPFAKPPSGNLQRYFEAMRLSEMIGPLDAAPDASLCYTTNFWTSSEEEKSLDFLIAQDEADEQPMERRRKIRAVLRSKNKMLDVLGAEARQAVDNC